LEQSPQHSRSLSRESKTYSFSRNHPPVLTINAGDTVVIDTYDARSGTIREPTDLLDKPHPLGLNPVTGPIYVNGVEPGDTLCIHIDAIELDRQGFTAVKAGVGLLAQRALEFRTRIVPIVSDCAIFSEELILPVQPMIGTIGVAPSSGAISTLYPGTHGGNMDNNYVATGATLFLPVFVPGALLSLGDVHASMGDGEVSMIGLDIAARVTLSVEVNKQQNTSRPWLETAKGGWVTTGDGLDLAAALRTACDEMVNLLMRRLGLSFADAYMLAGIRAHLGICQACDPGQFPASVRMLYEGPGAHRGET
jgi:amidase